MDYRSPPGFDRTRNSEIGNKNIKLEYLEEAYTTEHWLVRVYRVKKMQNRPRIKYVDRTVKAKSVFTSKKVRLFEIFKLLFLINHVLSTDKQEEERNS